MATPVPAMAIMNPYKPKWVADAAKFCHIGPGRWGGLLLANLAPNLKGNVMAVSIPKLLCQNIAFSFPFFPSAVSTSRDWAYRTRLTQDSVVVPRKRWKKRVDWIGNISIREPWES